MPMTMLMKACLEAVLGGAARRYYEQGEGEEEHCGDGHECGVIREQRVAVWRGMRGG